MSEEAINQINERLDETFYKLIDELQQENKQLKEVIAIKEKQLEEVRNNKTDYTKVNILEMQLDKYKEVIEEVREYIYKNSWLSSLKEFNCLTDVEVEHLVQILDKSKENK